MENVLLKNSFALPYKMFSVAIDGLRLLSPQVWNLALLSSKNRSGAGGCGAGGNQTQRSDEATDQSYRSTCLLRPGSAINTGRLGSTSSSLRKKWKEENSKRKFCQNRRGAPLVSLEEGGGGIIKSGK